MEGVLFNTDLGILVAISNSLHEGVIATSLGLSQKEVCVVSHTCLPSILQILVVFITLSFHASSK